MGWTSLGYSCGVHPIAPLHFFHSVVGNRRIVEAHALVGSQRSPVALTDIGKNRLQRIPADMNRIAADGKTPLLERIDARDRYPVIPAIQHFLDDRRLTGIRHRLLGLGGKERHQRKEQQRQTEQASFHNGT